MNFLPFVTIIITILALFSVSFFDRSIIGIREKNIYLAHYYGIREAKAERVEHEYTSRVKNHTPNTSSNQSREQHSPIKYFRNERIGWERGRLNLSSLLSDPQKWPALQEVAEAYIWTLYKDASFFPKDPEFPKTLINALVEIYQNSKTPPNLNEIILEDSLQTIFYKMLKGTHYYDLDHHQGYPPFASFFTFEGQESPPIQFHYANNTLLTIVLGEKNAQTLVIEEKSAIKSSFQKRSPFHHRSNLETLFSHNPPESSSLDLLDFEYVSSKEKRVMYQDPATQITVIAP
ncbi:MAG: hypothetical protein KDK76_00390 [Chlamydiia bacterium]|nr:hypothetical protein [Chlamydiia bacterium]